jgi:hypothetical protein
MDEGEQKQKYIKKKSVQKQNIETIQHEYHLKRNKFYPASPSPNIFCKRLEIRMKKYYNDLYKSVSL